MLSNTKLFVRCWCWSGPKRCMCFSCMIFSWSSCMCFLLCMCFSHFFLVALQVCMCWTYFFWCCLSKLDHPLELWTWLVAVTLELGTWSTTTFLEFWTWVLIATPFELQTLAIVPLKLRCWLDVAPLELRCWLAIVPLRLWTWIFIDTPSMLINRYSFWALNLIGYRSSWALNFNCCSSCLVVTPLELGTWLIAVSF